jgi:hypothetical protein
MHARYNVHAPPPGATVTSNTIWNRPILLTGHKQTQSTATVPQADRADPGKDTYFRRMPRNVVPIYMQSCQSKTPPQTHPLPKGPQCVVQNAFGMKSKVDMRRYNQRARARCSNHPHQNMMQLQSSHKPNPLYSGHTAATTSWPNQPWTKASREALKVQIPGLPVPSGPTTTQQPLVGGLCNHTCRPPASCPPLHSCPRVSSGARRRSTVSTEAGHSTSVA